MNRKIKRLLEPSLRMSFVIMIVFAVVTYFCTNWNMYLAIGEAAVILVFFIYSQISGHRNRREIVKYIESLTYDVDAATKDTMLNFPLPMVIFTLDEDKIIYSNDDFLQITGEHDHIFERSISDVVPTFPTKWLMEGKSECPGLVTVRDKRYRVYGSLVRSERENGSSYLATTYWMDVTEYAETGDEFQRSKPVFSIIIMDNYEELLSGLSEKDKSAILAEIDERVNAWAGNCGGYLCKYDRDRYIFVFEDRYLQGFIDGKFSLLDAVREVKNAKGIQATVSIGLGRDGKSMGENYQFAALSMEMALSRGGDQAVIKNRYNFDFYGGKTSQVEKQTKVKSRVLANSLTELMRAASTIYVMGHAMADLDCVGAAVGICCAARKLNKRCRIVLDPEKNSSQMLISRMKMLPEYADTFISPQTALLECDGNSLLVVVDTNRPEQVESAELLDAMNRVAVIDHHRRAATYIQNAALSFHEPYASSACELVAELLQYMVEQTDILRFEAEALLAGMVLDTKNFVMRTGARTFEAAAFVRRAGADTGEVRKFLQTDMKSAMARFGILQKARMYKGGIAIAATDTEEDRVIASQVADELLNIAGVQASFVIYPVGESVNISARSGGSVNVQIIVEKLGGGGNKTQAGAQISDKSLKEVGQDLLQAIDDYLEDVSATTTTTQNGGNAS